MRHFAAALLMLGLLAGSAAAAPFATVAFRKGESALVYDISTVDREGPFTRVWTYLIVSHPLDGATMVATRREFVCSVEQRRDLARRFVSPTGDTLRAVEAPGPWQTLVPGDEDYGVLEQVCGRKPALRVVGKGLSVFDFHDVVRGALGARTNTVTASR
jgi:hypothetical protein